MLKLHEENPVYSDLGGRDMDNDIEISYTLRGEEPIWQRFHHQVAGVVEEGLQQQLQHWGKGLKYMNVLLGNK